ncbi:amidase [Desmospora profundinema]|uniref:Asp-tRNA(Asn)/Glu-tRNA(Gln) amidotransferase A subunit family amidase n=1 Tax=Desmospora profundinema TaxID=1571184 RepID=A0ABU1IPY4_9BACL|nr:amidase [Desmospora profundinema]MDR6226857.1 Asp-tRNA(Asn)/Glu-tRNA(Gln) amidotransferase A subunit family amidase [Desmospora profundinema]
MSILDLDATAVAEKIRKQELSSLEATDTYIAHLKKIQPAIRCLVEDRFEQAREEARQADEEQKRGTVQGRLFGVPISIKESFDVAGMRTTGGLVHRKDHLADQDATLVASLRKEGAIVLGKTNTPTLCFCQETENKLYGRTNNPWDVSRTAGGSSGGEGALIAAGGAAVGVGSDVGGSIRFPSHFNGVIGFKSGRGQVPQAGSFPPIRIPLQERMLGMGAMAKSVRDARLIHSIIAESSPPATSLESCDIVFPLQNQPYPLQQETKTLLNQVYQSLSRRFSVTDEEPPYYRESAQLWQWMMSIDGARDTAAIAFGDRPIRPMGEFFKERLWKKSDLHRYLLWSLIGANTFKPSKKQVAAIQQTIDAGDQELNSYLADRLLILPVYHRTAPPHGEVYRELFSIRKTFKIYQPFVAYANVWGLPALVIPVGEGEDGLPVAIQVIGGIEKEEAIFQLGEWLEQEFRGYVRAEL